MYSSRFKEPALILVFAIVVFASGADLVADLSHGADPDHIVKEAIIITISTVAIAWLLWGLHQQRLEIRSLQQELETANNPQGTPKKYVLQARHTLGNVVTRQFSEWSLTGSETEVGWLLLKGLSLKEIAMVRSTQEKTVRQL